MTELTDTERETLLDAVGFMWTPSDWLGIQDAVEAILTARLARIEALAEQWEGRVVGFERLSESDDGDIYDCGRADTARVMYDDLRRALRPALAAPTPDEVQSSGRLIGSHLCGEDCDDPCTAPDPVRVIPPGTSEVQP